MFVTTAAGYTCSPSKSHTENQPSAAQAAPDVIPNPVARSWRTSVRDLLFGEQDWITRSSVRAQVLRLWALDPPMSVTIAGRQQNANPR